MMRTIFISLITLSLLSCISIKKNMLIEKQFILEKRADISFAFGNVTLENGNVVSDNYLNDKIIDFNNENCIIGPDWKMMPNIARENAFGARQACEIQIFLSKISKIEKVKLVSEKKRDEVFVHIKNITKSDGNKFFAYLGVFTLFIIPAKGEVIHEWEVTVYKNGIEKKKYKYEDGFTVWHSIFLLPINPFVDGYNMSISDLNQKFVNNLVYDLSKDGYLQ